MRANELGSKDRRENVGTEEYLLRQTIDEGRKNYRRALKEFQKGFKPGEYDINQLELRFDWRWNQGLREKLAENFDIRVVKKDGNKDIIVKIAKKRE